MQIRILPESSLPSIIFSFSLPDLPQELPIPQTWEVERQRIVAEDLDVPRSIYAFDKSSWISSIVQDVTFDLMSLTICVYFHDSSQEEWPLADQGCVRSLRNLLDEVRTAAEEERARNQPVSAPISSESQVTRIVRHKKKGSLFQFVVSLVSLSAAQPSPVACSSSTPEIPLSDIVTDLLLSHHPLRFRARSVLVDAYRRFVISELKSRLPPAGYTAWAANNMLRDTMDRMSNLIQRNGGIIPPPPLYSAPSVTRRSATHLFYDEDEEADAYSLSESLSTDTDGSSVHTPLSTPVGTEVRRYDRQSTQQSSSSEIVAYHTLQQQALQLRQLLVHVEITHRNEECEVRQLSAVLEVRSKRRAWSNRAYCGGATQAEIGLAMPKVSSPLARCDPITPETLEARREYHSLPRRRVEFDTTSLSIIAEEGRLTFPGDEVLAPPPLLRPRIRVRTHSSHQPPQAPDIEQKTTTPAKLGLQRLFEDDSPFGDAPAEFTLAVGSHELVGGMEAMRLHDDIEWVNNGSIAIASH
ncbi:hypothetical protein K488DRAFT_83634 [Vararia minispora EC-137]|uniref:Uncharacterized protein n=1 Tax=Vararia minispora EC-137 TaxID=1314806 RepID=A0ACB8QT47_9AGAM|nr:hypothetical protein K488DRAFT_83634 [Vararia minispora EC-137]